MPTAVERLLSRFLHLDIVAKQEQGELKEAFSNIDAEVQALKNAGSTRAFLGFEHASAHDFRVLGHSYVQTGHDLTQLAGFSQELFTVLGNLPGPQGAAAASTTRTDTTSLQTEFVALNGALRKSGADLATFGDDFVKVDGSVKPADFAAALRKVGGETSGLDDDLAHNQSTFLALGDDFIRRAAGDTSSIDFKLGSALDAVGHDFGLLSHDVSAIGRALGGELPQNAVEASTLLGRAGAAFATANDDFLKLNHDLGAIAGPAAAGVNSLLKNAFGGGGGTAFP